jgi:hypothetical protein
MSMAAATPLMSSRLDRAGFDPADGDEVVPAAGSAERTDPAENATLFSSACQSRGSEIVKPGKRLLFQSDGGMPGAGSIAGGDHAASAKTPTMMTLVIATAPRSCCSPAIAARREQQERQRSA